MTPQAALLLLLWIALQGCDASVLCVSATFALITIALIWAGLAIDGADALRLGLR